MNKSSECLVSEFDQICLANYLVNQNAAYEAKCKAEGAIFIRRFQYIGYCLNALTTVDLARMGVYTVEQYKQWSAENEALCDAKEDRKNSY
jgi:hypothetical protein